eukprot:TRINITY_DN781_c2_g1_i3.p1 TRINITY_DN781_c2_g1~~TRINITY_DN781_c2_g1_i3.p1  ORF type:complete len:1089 (-),score=249.14 TRINITY_DN781_c2_g1_i3:119-3385(-)
MAEEEYTYTEGQEEFVDYQGEGAEDELLPEEELLPADEEEAAQQEAQQETTQITGLEIVTDSFGDLALPEEQIKAVEIGWDLLVKTVGGRDAVAAAIYDTFYNASTALQDLFVTPKRVLTFQIYLGLNNFFTNARKPDQLRMLVESLGNRHLGWEVTIPRINIIRDAVVDLMVAELGSKLTSAAATGFVSLLNYIGGAVIYIRETYKERMMILLDSWRMANDESKNAERMASASMEEKKGHQGGETQKEEGETDHTAQSSKKQEGAQNIPTTFKEMFLFNAAVMGFGQNLWMNEVLAVLDDIVSNFRNVNRCQEECFVLTVRIAKVASGKVNLAEFKSCMLASLRSLLPKEWTTAHETAWSWCWERVELMTMENMGKTARWEKAFGDMLGSIDEATGYQLRQDMYFRFFEVSTEGESFFKQNMSYLHLVITKVLGYCMLLYQDPVQYCDEMSGLGLRHVGYAVPIDLLVPFAEICVGVIKDLGVDETSLKSFQWPVLLIARMVGRIIGEGSTVVMRAVNINSPPALRLAIACSARGQRAEWMLLIKVGTRDISPLLWSIQSGAIEAGLAMVEDLLTIRADRDNYYYEVNYLFKRHPDIIRVIFEDAPTLLFPLLNRLIWRSRATVNGLRRVNYYIKHLLIAPDGSFAPTLQWVVASKDPKVMVHPVLVFLGDVVWSGLASRAFITKKAWLVFTLIVFVICQSVLKSVLLDDPSNKALPYVIFVFRGFIYLFSMGAMVFSHTSRILRSLRTGDVVRLAQRFAVPTYLSNWQETANLVLAFFLIAMLCTEPMLYCLSDDTKDENGPMFIDWCKSSDNVRGAYYVFATIGTCLYFALLRDLAVFSNHVSAYVLVAGRTLAQLGMHLLAMFCVLLTLSSGLSCLEQDLADFKNIPSGFLTLWDMMLEMYTDQGYVDLRTEPVVFAGVYVYLILTAVFMFNLLIAQMAVSYRDIYADMVGFARLKRSQTIVETMPSVSAKKWDAFKASLSLDERIEFGEGDLGIAGGLQVQEAANLHPTTVDIIKRVGGSTAVTAQWPEDGITTEGDKFATMENLLKTVIDKYQSKNVKAKKNHGPSSGASGSGMGSTGEAEE